MTLFVSTESGSLYELDRANRRLRRLRGRHDPTPRQGPDGQWKNFVSIRAPRVGRAMVVVWEYEGRVAKSLITTRVTVEPRACALRAMTRGTATH